MTIERALATLRHGLAAAHDLDNVAAHFVDDAIEELTEPCGCEGKFPTKGPPCECSQFTKPHQHELTCPNNCTDGRVAL